LAIAAILVRWGVAAENLAWLLVFILAPISGIYYPIEVLPAWLQPIAWMFPAPYVFEGMRAVLFHHEFRADLMLAALALDALYLLLGAGIFLYSFRVARVQGLLLRAGE
jgi:ABC-2 type transport system permease protein